MTTHRNLKPHYAERKGKSGPVIVVKKGRRNWIKRTRRLPYGIVLIEDIPL